MKLNKNKSLLEKQECDGCNKSFSLKKIFKFTWRYHDKERTYLRSNIKIIHSGSKYLCEKCLKLMIK